MNVRKFFALCCVVMTMLFAVGSAADAVPPYNNLNGRRGGGGGRQYFPSRPPVSPLINLSRGRGFGFDPAISYYTYILPARQQQAFNRQQSAAIGQLQQQVQQVGTPIYSGGPGQPVIRPTGTNAWFMTHLPYFGAGQFGSGTFGAGGGGGTAPATGAGSAGSAGSVGVGR